MIDIKAADYSFINEVIAQIVCDQLQIESLTLIKAKSIREFDDHYAKCYDSSYAPTLVAMLMAIVDRSSLGYRVVSRSTLFRVSLCFSESYR